jgi:hypothetical protein
VLTGVVPAWQGHTQHILVNLFVCAVHVQAFVVWASEGHKDDVLRIKAGLFGVGLRRCGGARAERLLLQWVQ